MLRSSTRVFTQVLIKADVPERAGRTQTVVSRRKPHYVNIVVSLLVSLFLTGASGFSE